MILNFFQQVRDFFMEIFSNFGFGSLVTLLMGIIIGFMLFGIIYVILIFTAFKKDEIKTIKNIPDIEEEEVKRLIRGAKNQYIEEFSSATTTVKFDQVKKISWQLLNDIAVLYYPESKYPVYELSVDELIILNHYITNRIDSIFKGPILKNVKKVKISQILKFIDLKRKMDENKVVKASKKYKVSNAMSVVLGVVNILNPAYWVKKLITNTTMVAASNKIALTIIEVVGEETNKVYSKSVFNVEKELDNEIEKSINEIETMINE